jgi:integrase
LIDKNRADPARWKGHLEQLLTNSKKLGERRGNAATPHADVSAFMATLQPQAGGGGAHVHDSVRCPLGRGVFGATWDEIDLDAGVWTVPPGRMKMARPRRVQVDILGGPLAMRIKNPHVFLDVRPRQSLSVMALAMAMRRLGAREFTPHGFRSAFRDY